MSSFFIKIRTKDYISKLTDPPLQFGGYVSYCSKQ